MGSHRLRTKYRYNRTRRRMERIKLAALVLICAAAIGGSVWWLLGNFSQGLHPVNLQPQNGAPRLGGEN